MRAVRTGECCAERLKHKLWAVTLSFPPGTDTATKWMPRRISCNKMGYFHQSSFRILIRRCLLHESAGNLRIESKARQSHYHTSCQRQDDFGYRDTTAKPSLRKYKARRSGQAIQMALTYPSLRNFKPMTRDRLWCCVR